MDLFGKIPFTKSQSSSGVQNTSDRVIVGQAVQKFTSIPIASLQKLMSRESIPNYVDNKVLYGHKMENIANDTENAVDKLRKSWDVFTEHYPAKVQFLDKTFEKLLRLTAKAVFHGKFTKTVSAKTKTKLKDSVTACGFKMENGSPHMSICITFSLIIDEPWKKFVGTLPSSLSCQDMEEIWKEEGWILLEERLEILMSTKMIDHAAIILEVCINKGRQWHHLCTGENKDKDRVFDPFYFSYEKFVQYMIVYVFLWNRNPNKYKAFDRWTSNMFQEVIKFLLLKEQEIIKESKLLPKLKDWKKANKIALPFLETGIWTLLRREGSNLTTLEDMIDFWIDSVPMIQDENATEIPHVASIMNRINEVSSSAYIYLLGDVIKKNKVGLPEDVMRAKFVEVYVRAMSMDMANIEVQKSKKNVDKEKVLDMQKELAKNFVKIADVFHSHPDTSFQFLLTAHCLHPQQSLYQRLFPDSLNSPESSECSNLIPKCIDSAQTLKLPITLCEDLTTVINNPRWKAICGWTSKDELKNLCHVLLTNGGDAFIKEKELEYINIDYDKFKNLKPSVDPDDDGIEKGYGYGEKRKPRKLVRISALVPNRIVHRAKETTTKLERVENGKPPRIMAVKRNFVRKIGNSLTRTLIKKKEAHNKYAAASIASKSLRTKIIANKYKRRLLLLKDCNSFKRPQRKPHHKVHRLPKFLPSGYEIPSILPINISDLNKSSTVTNSQSKNYFLRLTICSSERKTEDQVNLKAATSVELPISDNSLIRSETCKLSSYRFKKFVNSNVSSFESRSTHLPFLHEANVTSAEKNWRKKLSAKSLREVNCHPKVKLHPEPLLNVELVKFARESQELMAIIRHFKLEPVPPPQNLNTLDVVSNESQYYLPAPKSIKSLRQEILKREMITDCQDRLAYFVESKRRALHELIDVPAQNSTNDTLTTSHSSEENISQDLQPVAPAETPSLQLPHSDLDKLKFTNDHQLENYSDSSSAVSKLQINAGIIASPQKGLQSSSDTASTTSSLHSPQRLYSQSNNSEIPIEVQSPYKSNFESALHSNFSTPERQPFKGFETYHTPDQSRKSLPYDREVSPRSVSPKEKESQMPCQQTNSNICIQSTSESLHPYNGDKGPNGIVKSPCPLSEKLNFGEPIEAFGLTKSVNNTILSITDQSATPVVIKSPYNMNAKRKGIRKSRSSSESVLATIDCVVGSNDTVNSCVINQMSSELPVEALGNQMSCANGLISDCGEKVIPQSPSCEQTTETHYAVNGEYCVPTKHNLVENQICETDYLPNKLKHSGTSITNSIEEVDHNNENDPVILTAMDLSTHNPHVGDVAKQLQEIIESVPVLKDPSNLPQKGITGNTSLLGSQEETSFLNYSETSIKTDSSDTSAMQTTPTLSNFKTNSSNGLQHSDAGTYCNLQENEDANKQETPTPVYTDFAAVAALCDIPIEDEEGTNTLLPRRKIRKRPHAEQKKIRDLLLLCNKEITIKILPCDSPINKNPISNPRPVLQMKNDDPYSANDEIIILKEIISEDHLISKTKNHSFNRQNFSSKKRNVTSATKNMEISIVDDDDDEIQVLNEVPPKCSRLTRRRTDFMHRDIRREYNFKSRCRQKCDRVTVSRIIKNNCAINGVRKRFRNNERFTAARDIASAKEIKKEHNSSNEHLVLLHDRTESGILELESDVETGNMDTDSSSTFSSGSVDDLTDIEDSDISHQTVSTKNFENNSIEREENTIEDLANENLGELLQCRNTSTESKQASIVDNEEAVGMEIIKSQKDERLTAVSDIESANETEKKAHNSSNEHAVLLDDSAESANLKTEKDGETGHTEKDVGSTFSSGSVESVDHLSDIGNNVNTSHQTVIRTKILERNNSIEIEEDVIKDPTNENLVESQHCSNTTTELKQEADFSAGSEDADGKEIINSQMDESLTVVSDKENANELEKEVYNSYNEPAVLLDDSTESANLEIETDGEKRNMEKDNSSTFSSCSVDDLTSEDNVNIGHQTVRTKHFESTNSIHKEENIIKHPTNESVEQPLHCRNTTTDMKQVDLTANEDADGKEIINSQVDESVTVIKDIENANESAKEPNNSCNKHAVQLDDSAESGNLEIESDVETGKMETDSSSTFSSSSVDDLKDVGDSVNTSQQTFRLENFPSNNSIEIEENIIEDSTNENLEESQHCKNAATELKQGDLTVANEDADGKEIVKFQVDGRLTVVNNMENANEIEKEPNNPAIEHSPSVLLEDSVESGNPEIESDVDTENMDIDADSSSAPFRGHVDDVSDVEDSVNISHQTVITTENFESSNSIAIEENIIEDPTNENLEELLHCSNTTTELKQGDLSVGNEDAIGIEMIKSQIDECLTNCDFIQPLDITKNSDDSLMEDCQIEDDQIKSKICEMKNRDSSHSECLSKLLYFNKTEYEDSSSEISKIERDGEIGNVSIEESELSEIEHLELRSDENSNQKVDNGIVPKENFESPNNDQTEIDLNDSESFAIENHKIGTRSDKEKVKCLEADNCSPPINNLEENLCAGKYFNENDKDGCESDEVESVGENKDRGSNERTRSFNNRFKTCRFISRPRLSEQEKQKQRKLLSLPEVSLEGNASLTTRSLYRKSKAKLIRKTPSPTFESSSDDDRLPCLVHISPIRKRLKTSTDEDDSPPPTLDLYLSK